MQIISKIDCFFFLDFGSELILKSVATNYFNSKGEYIKIKNCILENLRMCQIFFPKNAK